MTPPNDHTEQTVASPDAALTITQVAERVGITAGALRIWEERYGWPRPERHPNGNRRYPESLVKLLARVKTEIDLGKTIGDLMRDAWWQNVFQTGRLPESPGRSRSLPPWSALPPPSTAVGRDIFTRLQQALVCSDAHLARWARAMGEQLHPVERERAVKAVLRMWHQHQA